MQDERCKICNKLLFKGYGNYKIEIKCPKCKNIIKIENTNRVSKQ